MMTVEFIARMLVDDCKVKIRKEICKDARGRHYYDVIEETTAGEIKKNGNKAELKDWRLRGDTFIIDLN